MHFADTRYNRQELMPQVGVSGQSRLSESKVMVIGAGGVKSSLLLYLASAGVGTIRVVDDDRVELSNLNRQILFDTNDIGLSKAEAAGRRLSALNPEVSIDALVERVDQANISDLCSGFDVVVEGGDSLAGRLLINQHCLRSHQPMVHASAQYGYGYVLTVMPHETACFECVFPDLPRSHGGSVPVIGIATGLAGVLGASEVMKICLGTGALSTNGLTTFSIFQNEFTFVPSVRRDNCKACGDDTR